MKKLSFVYIFFILLLFIGCKNNFNVTTVEFQSDDYKISLELPEYKSNSVFSNYINACLTKDMEAYKAFAEEENKYNRTAGFDTELFTYRTSVQDFSNSQYLNVLVRKYIYSGPNMEDEYLLSFNYDKKSKKIISIFDVYNESENKLKNTCIDMLKNQHTGLSDYDKTIIYDCIDLSFNIKRNLFESFILDKNNITIFFAPDLVVPKGYGEQKVVIRR